MRWQYDTHAWYHHAGSSCAWEFSILARGVLEPTMRSMLSPSHGLAMDKQSLTFVTTFCIDLMCAVCNHGSAHDLTSSTQDAQMPHTIHAPLTIPAHHMLQHTPYYIIMHPYMIEATCSSCCAQCCQVEDVQKAGICQMLECTHRIHKMVYLNCIPEFCLPKMPHRLTMAAMPV